MDINHDSIKEDYNQTKEDVRDVLNKTQETGADVIDSVEQEVREGTEKVKNVWDDTKQNLRD